MNPLLNIGIKAARTAGKLIIRYVDQINRLRVEKKGRDDFVSEVDRMAEDAIIEIIRKGYPNHTIIAEESGISGGADGAAEADADLVTWIIDPLDGTTNFLHGHPNFCVSIGIKQRGIIQHGVVLDPLRNELFTASYNQGAQLNDRRIWVSGQKTLKSSLIAIGCPRPRSPGYDTWLQCVNSVLPRCASVRHTGAAALDLVYVACGRTDAFFEPGLQPWDMAAGSLIVREARGLVTDFAGQQAFMESGNILCANPRLFNELLTTIADHYATPTAHTKRVKPAYQLGKKVMRKKAAPKEVIKHKTTREKATRKETIRKKDTRGRTTPKEAIRKQDTHEKTAYNKPIRKSDTRKKTAYNKPIRKSDTRKKTTHNKPLRKSDTRKKTTYNKPMRKPDRREKTTPNKPLRKSDTRKKAAYNKPIRKPDRHEKATYNKPMRKPDKREKTTPNKPMRKSDTRKKTTYNKPMRKPDKREKTTPNKPLRKSDTRKKTAYKEKEKEKTRREKPSYKKKPIRKKTTPEAATRKKTTRKKSAKTGNNTS